MSEPRAQSPLPGERPTEPVETPTPPTRALWTQGQEPAAPTTVQGGPGADTIRDSVLPEVPGFVLVRELGRGGMGVVYQGQHVALGRDVALKMILSGDQASVSDRVRFQTEAQAVARLQHPGIVQIYEIGESNGRPYFALEFCSGGSLAAQINGTPLEPRRAAQITEHLARAMDAAHAHGVVHRDLKPANVLLDAEGTPKVTDFGLARKVGEVGETVSGTVLGTPSYMPPEQALGRVHELGPAVDVYALGALLYECLTGRPPFRGATSFDTLEQVVSREPVPPSHLNAKVPRDLETICLKCLHKEADRRYARALDLADDLQRFQSGEPIQARPVGPVERAWRWGRRNPGVAALGTAFVLSLVVGILVAGYFAIQADHRAREAESNAHEARTNAHEAETNANKARTNAHEARTNAHLAQRREREANKNAEQFRAQKVIADRESEHAREEALKARRNLYLAHMHLANRAWQEGDTPTTLAFLERQRPVRPGPGDLRGFEWHYLWRLSHSDLLTLSQRSDPAPFLGFNPLNVAFTPDGREVLLAEIKMASMREGEGSPPQGPGGLGLGIPALPLVGPRGTLKRWNARTGQPIGSVTFPGSTTTWMSLSPDGRRLALPRRRTPGAPRTGPQIPAAGQLNTVEIIDTKTGKEVLSLPHGEILYHTAFSPDGRRLVSVGGIWDKRSKRSTGGTIKLWSLDPPQADKPIRTFEGVRLAVQQVAFSPDGTRLATADSNGTVKVWDVATGKEGTILNALAGGGPPVFSPDGELIARCGPSRVVVWDVKSGKEVVSLPTNHPIFSEVPVFSPDGQNIAAVAGQGTVKLWDIVSGAEWLTLRGHRGQLQRVCFSPDGRRLLTGGTDAVQVWDITTNPEGLDLPVKGSFPDALGFSPDGTRFAGPEESVLKLWDTTTGREVRALSGHKGKIDWVAWSADGRRIAATAGSTDAGGNPAPGEVKVWEAATGKELRTFPVGRQQPLLALMPGGRERQQALDPKGRFLVLAGFDQKPVILDIDTGLEYWKPAVPEGSPRAVTFSPDGRLLAVAISQLPLFLGDGGPRETGEVLVLDPVARRALRTLPDIPAGELRFSPDGRYLAVLRMHLLPGTSGVIQVWDVATGKKRLSIDWPCESLQAVAFSPDGRQFATGGFLPYDVALRGVHAPDGEDRTVQLWDLERPGTAALALRLRGHAKGIRAIAYSPDGRRLASCGYDQMVKVWDTATGEELLTFRETNPTFTWAWISFDASGRRLAAAGGILLTVDGWIQRVRLWDTEEPTPASRATRARLLEDGALEWHYSQAEQANANGKTFAVRFHLPYLDRARPTTPDEYLRRGRLRVGGEEWQKAIDDLSKSLEKNPENAETLALRGHARAARGLWNEARKDYDRAVALGPEQQWIWAEHAALCLKTKDLAAYRRTCASMVQRFAETEDLSEANTLAWTCALAPAALPQEGLLQVMNLLEDRLAADPRDEASLGTLGAIAYRADHLQKAVQKLTTVVKGKGEGGTVEDRLFKAMTNFRLKRVKEAKRLLNRAHKLIANGKPDGWEQKVQWEILRAEADALIGAAEE
jgi:WD40 repeat protein/serine/threonine protein kinase/tetratricopeptide (TPR) repeat protein